MSRALSTHAHTVALVIFTALMVGSSGCRPSHPVVVNPTEPWEDELARERQAAQNAEESSPGASIGRQMYGTDEAKEEEPKHNPFVVAVADIIAFPFRGAGWLARQIF